MFLTNKARYAVMSMLEMALSAGKDAKGIMKLSEIAGRQGIAVQFLEQIFIKLKQHNLVNAVRGPGGGYRIVGDAKSISIADIVHAVEEKIKMTRCASDGSRGGCMVHGTAKCDTHHLWENLENHIQDYLSARTLHDVLMKKQNVRCGLSEIYFDHNATTKLLPEVQEALLELYQHPLNASSVHTSGRIAKSYLESARKKVKALVNADDHYHLVFTSSGTEANNLAILGLQDFTPVVSVLEHASIRNLVPQALLDIDQHGVVKLDSLEKVLSSNKSSALVSVMLANNEIGVIQPLAEIARLTHKKSGLVHTDASQCPGKMSIDVVALGVDMMTISAHKFGGPLGVAALIFKKDLDLTPVIRGGGQEYRFRSGTHNIQAIHGFGVACAVEPTYRALMRQTSSLRDYIEQQLSAIAQSTIFFGQHAPRLCNTSSIAMPGVNAESQVIHFDLHGIAVSAGSACSSGVSHLPYVHMAMGYPESVAKSALRISLGIGNTKEESDKFIQIWRDLYLRASANNLVKESAMRAN